MPELREIIDIVLHLNKHLGSWTEHYGGWIYLILFLVVFCETGLVVTPFLPGDSLLFAVGALCAAPSPDLASPLNLYAIFVLLIPAAILGDTVNYWIGHYSGPKVFRSETNRFLNRANLEKAHLFYEKYGGKAIILCRFMPLFRTFVPFVAGIGKMSYARFMSFNVIGGIVWVLSFTLLGYFFGNREVVKKNFSLVILLIIVVSLLPAVYEFIRHRRDAAITKRK
ncbi:MAG: DedA family protein [Opitutaceae bacterium]|nr:DedA family protein [Verrucomicrobiales bacterium]